MRLCATPSGEAGRVYIPTFALERAQEVLYALERLHEKNQVPEVPIFIDSPLAIAVTEIYKLHPESLAEEVRARILSRNDPFSPPGLQYVSDVKSSRDLQERAASPASLSPVPACARVAGFFTISRRPSRIARTASSSWGSWRSTRWVDDWSRGGSQSKFSVSNGTLLRRFTRSTACLHMPVVTISSRLRNERAKLGASRGLRWCTVKNKARQSLAEGLKEAGVPKVIQSKKGERVEL